MQFLPSTPAFSIDENYSHPTQLLAMQRLNDSCDKKPTAGSYRPLASRSSPRRHCLTQARGTLWTESVGTEERHQVEFLWRLAQRSTQIGEPVLEVGNLAIEIVDLCLEPLDFIRLLGIRSGEQLVLLLPLTDLFFEFLLVSLLALSVSPL